MATQSCNKLFHSSDKTSFIII